MQFDRWAGSSSPDSITIIHPLSAMLAIRHALASCTNRGSASHAEIERAIVKVAVRMNSLVAEPQRSNGHPAATLTAALFWKSASDIRWFYWSYEVVSRLEAAKAGFVVEFEGAASLTLREWVLRTHAEFATRYMKGATAYDTTSGVEPRLEEAWQRFVTVPASTFASWCCESDLADPFDYGPLACRPILELEDGRRMPYSGDVLQRATTPNVIAQMLAEVTSESLDQVAATFGKIGEQIFVEKAKDMSPHVDAPIIFEDEIPGDGKRCEAVLRAQEFTAGFEVTHITPKRHLAEGASFSIEAYVERLATKLEQVLDSFDAISADKGHQRLACLVQTTPSVWHSGLDEAVAALLADAYDLDGVVFAVVNIFDLLDLVASSASTAEFVQKLQEWTTEYGGYELDYFMNGINPDHSGVKGDASRFDQAAIQALAGCE